MFLGLGAKGISWVAPEKKNGRTERYGLHSKGVKKEFLCTRIGVEGTKKEESPQLFLEARISNSPSIGDVQVSEGREWETSGVL